MGGRNDFQNLHSVSAGTLSVRAGRQPLVLLAWENEDVPRRTWDCLEGIRSENRDPSASTDPSEWEPGTGGHYGKGQLV